MKSNKKAVSKKGAMLLANLLKGKKNKVVPAKAAAVDAEDLVDKGADEDQEKS